MSKIIITGAAGFLGSHLTSKCLNQGHEVFGIDDLSTGALSNLEEFQQDQKFEFIEHNVSEGIPNLGSVDAIFHMACPASPTDFVRLAEQILKVGSLGTFNCCEYAIRHDAWMLMASTSEVYGDPMVHPQPETYLGNVNSIGVRGVYDESKRFSESVVSSFQRTRGLKSTIIRIFNTYGPKMRISDGRVVSNFINQALKGEDLTLYGDGEQTRSFCYVDDLIAGIYRCFEVQPAGPINLGNDQERSVKDLAESIKAMLESKSKIVYRDLPQDDPKQRRPVLDEAKRMLSWSPKVDLEAGISKTVAYFSKLN